MSDPTLFQYCQKIVLFRNNNSEVLLARRHGEADYDGVYSFIGGKLETTDGGMVSGLQREKNEEIGQAVCIRICSNFSFNFEFTKSSGQQMILPHYYAQYLDGEIALNADEYSEYKWVAIADLATFEPKIANIPEVVAWAQRLADTLSATDFTEL